MKLIYIANIRLPTEKAHGIQVMKTCEALAAEGVDLELWVPKRRNAAFVGVGPFDFYKVGRTFSISFLPSLDLIGLLDFLPGAGYFIQSRTFAWSVGWKLVSKKFKPEQKIYDRISFARGEKTPPVFYSRELSALAPIAKKGLPYFYEAHTLPKALRRRHLKILRKASGIVCISQHLAEVFKKYLSESRVHVAPDGADLKAFDGNVSCHQARSDLGFSQTASIIGYAGHLYEWKGARTLAEASEYLDENTIVFFLGGTQPDIEKFRQWCLQKGLRKAQVLGAVAPDKVPLYLAAADILALPNSGKFEISRAHTSPLKLFEYMAARRPIIASDLPSLREILDESTAVFFAPDDPLSLSRKIKSLLADRGLAERLATNAAQKVRAYSWQARARGIKQFMDSRMAR